MKLFKRELTLDELISGVESMMGLDDDMKKEMKAIFLKHNTTKGTRDGRRRSSNALSQVGVSPANDSHSSPSVIQGAVSCDGNIRKSLNALYKDCSKYVYRQLEWNHDTHGTLLDHTYQPYTPEGLAEQLVNFEPGVSKFSYYCLEEKKKIPGKVVCILLGRLEIDNAVKNNLFSESVYRQWKSHAIALCGFVIFALKLRKFVNEDPKTGSNVSFLDVAQEYQ